MGLLKGRRGGLARGTIRHSRAPGHLQECSECHAAVLRERQYLERLRRAAVPEASQDFTNRLIEHTQRLAQSDVPESAAPQRSVWHSIRLASAAAGGIAVSAGVLAVAAYAVGGEVAPQASNRGEQEVRTLVSSTAVSSTPPGSAGEQLPVTGSQLSLPVSVAGTVSLSEQQLSELRKDGWACPEMASMGYHMVSARALMEDGHPAVELHLSDGDHHATLVEQHLEGSGTSGTQLSVAQGAPWQAVYSSPVAVLRYSSDMPANQAAGAVPELVKAGDSLMVARPAENNAETWNDRLQRGLHALAGLAGF
jgi:anti-sigma factor RsiW